MTLATLKKHEKQYQIRLIEYQSDLINTDKDKNYLNALIKETKSNLKQVQIEIERYKR